MSESRPDKIRRRLQEHGEIYGRPRPMDIPKDKGYPERGVGQCDECGGHGCSLCHNTGWVSDTSTYVRRCHNDSCDAVIPPHQVAVYCTNACAFSDA